MNEKEKDYIKTALGIGFLAAIAGILLFFGLFFIESFIIQILWNFVVPTIMGFFPLSFWQACGIKLLTSFLFGVNLSYIKVILKYFKSKN